MTWLNQTLSVPVIGIRLAPRFRAAAVVLDQLEPWISTLYRDGGGMQLQVDNNYSLRVQGQGVANGYHCAIDHQNVVLGYQYSEVRHQLPGALPGLESSELQTFETLLDQVLDHLARVLELLFQGGPRDVLRVGFVAHCALVHSAAPPGVLAFLDHLGRPWSRGLTAAEGKVVALLQESEDYTERCHHQVSFDVSERPDDLRLALDWQRVHRTARTLNAAELVEEVQHLRHVALDYFDAFASGDLDYADAD